MAEDKNNEQEKFDFTPEGEGYISLDEARVLAIRTAVASPGDYGRDFRRVTMVFDVVASTETEDHYTVTLSFRPQGNFDGTPGQEQFVVGKDGTIAVRQVLGLPIQTSAQPADTGRKGGGFPLIPVAIGVVVVGIIAAVGAIFLISSSGGESVPVAAVAPTQTPTPTQLPAPTETLAPTTTPAPTETPVPTPTFTPMPTYNPGETAGQRFLRAWPYYARGDDYRQAGNWVMAISEYTRAVEIHPTHGPLNNRGISYARLGQYQNAINDYTKAIQIAFSASDEAMAYNNRGLAYRALGQPTLADADKTMACSLDSQWC